MDAALRGKTALVLGGAGGIGGAAARALSREGASVTIASRSEDRIAAFAKELATDAPEGAEVSFVVTDALREQDVARAVEHAGAGGALDICVSTVGRGQTRPLLLGDADTFTEELRMNVTTAFVTVKHCVPAMVRAGGGSIVFTSSVISEQSYPYMTGYCAGKAGLEGFVRAAADEVSHLGVRINCVRPGLVRAPDNPKVGPLFADGRVQRFLEQIPLGRVGSPSDVGEGIRYLAGPESAWVTGTSLPVDGGNHLRRAPDIVPILREALGDETVDQVLAGEAGHVAGHHPRPGTRG